MYLKIFAKRNDWLFDLKTCAVTDMNDVLCQFYKCSSRKAGYLYKKASCLSARASLELYVTIDLKRLFNVIQTP